MESSVVTHFSFWKPVEFNQIPFFTKPIFQLAWEIGNWADQYASVGHEILFVKPIKKIDKMDFCKLRTIKETHKQLAKKISTFFITLFMLPAIALAIKIIFKIYLNSLIYQKNEVIAEKQIGNTKFVLLNGSLLDEKTDAIVNAANTSLAAGGGICGVINEYVGNEPFTECGEILKQQNRISLDPGEAVLTSPGLMKTLKAIIHTPGPIYNSSIINGLPPSFGKKPYTPEEIEAYKAMIAFRLSASYHNSLTILTDPNKNKNYVSPKLFNIPPMRSISFPSISTGIFGYPLDSAASIAIQTIKSFIEKNPNALNEVHFVFLPLSADPKTSIYYTKEFLKLDGAILNPESEVAKELNKPQSQQQQIPKPSSYLMKIKELINQKIWLRIKFT